MISTLIINLESESERREFQETQCARYGLDYRILKAVNKDQISTEYKLSYGQSWVRPMRDTELACTLSHMNAWKIVADSGQPHLICEDDAVFSADIESILQDLTGVTKYDLVQLETFTRTKLIAKTSDLKIAARDIHKLYHGYAGAAGYVLWPSGARILLDESARRTAPADAFISDLERIIAGQLIPAAIVQVMRAKSAGVQEHLQDTVSAINNAKKPKAETLAWVVRYKLRRLRVEMHKLRIILKHLGHSKKVVIPFA